MTRARPIRPLTDTSPGSSDDRGEGLSAGQSRPRGLTHTCSFSNQKPVGSSISRASVNECSGTGTDDAPPEPDLATRAAIVKKLAAARASVAAIDCASVGVREAASRIGLKLAALEPSIEQAVALVAIDEASTLLPTLAAAIETYMHAKARYDAGWQAVQVTAHFCHFATLLTARR